MRSYSNYLTFEYHNCLIATSTSAGGNKTENVTSTILLIRNAMLKINYCGHTFLVDPQGLSCAYGCA